MVEEELPTRLFREVRGFQMRNVCEGLGGEVEIEDGFSGVLIHHGLAFFNSRPLCEVRRVEAI